MKAEARLRAVSVAIVTLMFIASVASGKTRGQVNRVLIVSSPETCGISSFLVSGSSVKPVTSIENKKSAFYTYGVALSSRMRQAFLLCRTGTEKVEVRSYSVSRTGELRHLKTQSVWDGGTQLAISPSGTKLALFSHSFTTKVYGIRADGSLYQTFKVYHPGGIGDGTILSLSQGYKTPNIYAHRTTRMMEAMTSEAIGFKWKDDELGFIKTGLSAKTEWGSDYYNGAVCLQDGSALFLGWKKTSHLTRRKGTSRVKVIDKDREFYSGVSLSRNRALLVSRKSMPMIWSPRQTRMKAIKFEGLPSDRSEPVLSSDEKVAAFLSSSESEPQKLYVYRNPLTRPSRIGPALKTNLSPYSAPIGIMDIPAGLP